jgi:hypothetical protein
VLLAVLLYLMADYCDPSIRGVFFFGTDSFFINGIKSVSVPSAVPPSPTAQPATRDVITPLRRAVAAARVEPRIERTAYPPRAQIIASPLASSGTTEDH